MRQFRYLRNCVVSFVVGCLLLCAPSVGYGSETTEITERWSSDLSAIEIEATSALMQSWGLAPAVSAEVIFSTNDQAQYILGCNQESYAIVDRDTWEIVETRKAISPYAGIADDSKYYGGPFCYLALEDDVFIDLMTGKEFNQDDIGIAFQCDDTLYEENHESRAPEDLLALAVSNNNLVTISDSYNLTRRSFGYNEHGTCSAVSAGIVLNYLDKHVSDSFVPNNMEAEYLTSGTVVFDKQAQRLHTYMTEDCGMHKSLLNALYASKIASYVNKTESVQSTGLFVSYRTDTKNYKDILRDMIDVNDRPFVLSTGSNAGEYSSHAMVAYGYKNNSDGTESIVVHLGWDNGDQDGVISDNLHNIVRRNGIYIEAEAEVNPRYVNAYYLYNYSLSGWHKTPNGWKYYRNNNAQEALVLNRLSGNTRYTTSQVISQYERSVANYAVLVSGEDTAWTDAACGAALSGVFTAPLLYTESSVLSSSTLEALQKLRTKNVLIVGGSNSVNNSIQYSLSSLGMFVIRICGEDRYKTAEEVYRFAQSRWYHPTGGYATECYDDGGASYVWKNGSKKKAALIVSGKSAVDAALATPMAAYCHFPIFFGTDDGGLTDETQRLLSNGNFDEVYCVGGGAKSAAAVASRCVKPASVTGLTDKSTGMKAGTWTTWSWAMYESDRYETAKTLFGREKNEGMSINVVAVTSGQSVSNVFPGASLKHPLLLADSTQYSSARESVQSQSSKISTLLTLGGTSSVPDYVVTELVRGWWIGKVGSAPADYSLNDLFLASPLDEAGEVNDCMDEKEQDVFDWDMADCADGGEVRERAA